MNSWGARIKAAISGEVDGADVRALLASTVPLTTLQQALADRRLEAEIGQQGEEWRVAVDLSEVAAPLWLAEAAVTLAGSLVDAEDEAHPARPGALSAVSHYHAMVLLEPVGQILSAVSATLVDPTRRTNLPLPLLFGQQAIATDRSLSSLPVAYLRGLLLGADRIEGAAQAALEATSALVGRSAAPPALSGGLQHLRGDLAAAGASLEIQRAAAAALLVSSAAGTALPQLAAALWTGIDALLRIGQLANAPRLLPGFALPAPPRLPNPPSVAQPPERSYQPRPQRSAPVPAPRQADPEVVPARIPPQIAIEETARSLPEVTPTWHVAAGATQQNPVPAATPAAPAARTLPRIGQPDGPEEPHPHAPPATAPSPPPQVPERERSMPEIGQPASPGIQVPTVRSRPTPQPAEHRPMPEIASKPGEGSRSSGAPTAVGVDTVRDPEQPRALPQIGGGAADRTPPSPPDDARAEQRTEHIGAKQLPTSPTAGGRRIEPKDRWLLSGPGTRHRLRGAGLEEQAEGALSAFWVARNWTLSPAASAYLDQVAALESTGGVVRSGRSLDEPPYPCIYRVAGRPLTLLGQTLQTGILFAFDYPHDRMIHPTPRDGVPD